MGVVSDYVRDLIIQQVAEHGLVVWYDPEGHYTALAQTLTISNTAVAHYSGSFFELRHQVEPLLERADPPRLVVYVPLDPAGAHQALVELELAGVVLKPGQQPPARNTRLSLLARHALKPLLGEEAVAEIEKQLDAGQLNLADLDAIAESGGGIASGVLSVIFGTGNAQLIALAFLSGAEHDGAILDKGAAPDLANLFQEAFEIDLPAAGTLEAWREQLARHVLTTEFAVRLAGELPAHLKSLKAATQPAACQTCADLARTWRLRHDSRDCYVSAALEVEKTLALTDLDAHWQHLVDGETFLAVELALQRQLTAAMLDKTTPDLVDAARQGQARFWAEVRPEVQAEWGLIASAGQVLLEADRIEQELKQPQLSVKAMFDRYTGGDPCPFGDDQADTPRPWCLLDTAHRHMERRCHQFDFDLAGGHASLEQLIVRARQRYTSVAAQLAERFLRQYQAAGFHISDVQHQRQVYEKHVKPCLAEGKTAYLWVDALRFEMARQLAETLSDEFTVRLQAAVGLAPSVTELGMAALLPGAHQSVAIVAAGAGKLGLQIGDTLLKDRQGRLDYLAATAGVKVFDTRLDDIMPKPNHKVKTGIQQADLILVTSQEIDALCEGDNISLARRTMDEVLRELRRAVRILAELGVQSIVVVADHGYLFGEEVGDDMKIDPPGGDTVALHRRAWVGHGGAADPACLRIALAEFGLDSDLELVTPWNLAVFKVQGGARAFFHGGLSHQELIVPILTLRPTRPAVPSVAGDIAWSLRLGGSSLKIGRYCSVQVAGQAKVLFELTPPSVRVEARSAAGKTISVPATASYGFHEGSGDVQLELKADDPRAIEPDAVALRIVDDTPQKNIVILLLDAASGAELARLSGVEVATSI